MNQHISHANVHWATAVASVLGACLVQASTAHWPAGKVTISHAVWTPTVCLRQAYRFLGDQDACYECVHRISNWANSDL